MFSGCLCWIVMFVIHKYLCEYTCLHTLVWWHRWRLPTALPSFLCLLMWPDTVINGSGNHLVRPDMQNLIENRNTAPPPPRKRVQFQTQLAAKAVVEQDDCPNMFTCAAAPLMKYRGQPSSILNVLKCRNACRTNATLSANTGQCLSFLAADTVMRSKTVTCNESQWIGIKSIEGPRRMGLMHPCKLHQSAPVLIKDVACTVSSWLFKVTHYSFPLKVP